MGYVAKVGICQVQGVLEYDGHRKEGSVHHGHPRQRCRKRECFARRGLSNYFIYHWKQSAGRLSNRAYCGITRNPDTFKLMEENFDISAGAVILGKETVADVGKRIDREILAVASGKPSKAEAFGFGEVFTNRLDPSYSHRIVPWLTTRRRRV